MTYLSRRDKLKRAQHLAFLQGVLTITSIVIAFCVGYYMGMCP